MRIFVQSSVFLPTPSPGAGAVEFLVAALTGYLASRGHEVVLFALAGSVPPPGVELMTVPPGGSAPAMENEMALRMAEASVTIGFPDVIFDHSMTMQSQKVLQAPAVSMCHGMAPLPAWAKNPVFTSEHHGRLHKVQKPRALRLGVDLAGIPQGALSAEREPYLLWVGRIMRYKQPHIAMDVAIAADIPIMMAGPIIDADYYGEECEQRIPMLRRTSGCRLALRHDEVLSLMRSARALLFTSTTEEPAGLVMLEAMASGCPVIAFDHGANPEYLHDKAVGLVRSPTGMLRVAREHAFDDIDRLHARAWVQENFTIERMGRQAEEYLQAAVKGERW